MKRRETLKSLLVGGIAGTAAVGMGALSCKADQQVESVETPEVSSEVYGRTPAEIKHDEKINSQICYNEHQLTTIAVLCDIYFLRHLQLEGQMRQRFQSLLNLSLRTYQRTMSCP